MKRGTGGIQALSFCSVRAGAIAAVNGADQTVPGDIAGVVLTETVSVMGGSGKTVFSADPEKI